MKITKHIAHSTQQQDSANHFSKTLHVASKAKNQPNNASAIAADAARWNARAEVKLQAAQNQQERANEAYAARLQAEADAQAAKAWNQSHPSATDTHDDATVANIVDDIRAKLAQGRWITHDQLEEISSSFDDLTPEQAQQVIEGLSDKELQTLATEMKAGGMLNLTGLTESERCEFIGMLASKLDAKQFQRVAEAFGDPATYAKVVLTQGTTSTQIGFKNAFNLSTDEFLTKAVEGMDDEELVEFIDNASTETLIATMRALEKTDKLREQWGSIIDAIAQKGTSEQLINFMQVLNDEVEADPNPKHPPMLTATMLMAAVSNSPSQDVREEFLAAVAQMDQFKGVAQLDQFSTVWGQDQDRRFAIAVMLMQDASLTPERLSHDQDMANLASAVYDSPTIPSYYQEVDFNDPDLDPRLKGLSTEDFDDEDSGFSSGLYLDSRTNTYVLAFRGTDPNEAVDWVTDFLQGTGNETVQYDLAMSLAQRLQERLGPDLTDITGHSLGGGLAAAASIVTGIPATTFDAAGVNPETVKRYGKTLDDGDNIINYRVRGEVLTWVQEESPIAGKAYDAVGRQITIELFDNNQMSTGASDLDLERRVAIHLPEFFLSAMLIDQA